MMRTMNVILLLSMAILLAGCKYDFTRLGDDLGTAKTALFGVSSEEEREIGREAAATLLGASPLLAHEPTQRYVNRVGRWVAMQSARPDLSWHFGVIDNPNINAFAAPDGYVFVTTGLLQQIQSESELAGVLGHEIAHVVEKHHLEALESGARLSLAGRVAEETLRDKGKDVGKYAWVIEGTKTLYTQGLGRDDELSADRLGVVLAARAGYEPYGLVAVLQRLDALAGKSSELALLFKTHPAPSDRLEHILGRIPTSWSRLEGNPAGEDRFRSAMLAWVQAGG